MTFYKDKILDYLNERALRKNKVKRFNTSYRDSRLLGILFTWEHEQKLAMILDFIRKMEIHGKSIDWLCLVNSKKIKLQDDIPYYSPDDISIFGNTRNESIKKFIDTPYDFLFHLDLGTNQYVDYILSRCHSICRVGKYDPAKKDFYDFMIKPQDDADLMQLYDQIIHYTKSITTDGQSNI